ncbi:transcriptional regulator, XRE family [Rippkaea orientalis PCC 8801]|uniref:Transcriptional regulator, XRE family n=1 Tax=Rippkaea orientalis (strain PCC 8801 / RF-1) TaxID=41431 RepID=B7JUW6_RIPO1|nr:transcriptional regulator [Rippkaea orientalis]ACK66818.1 transcriptional regulator, XRE family [Rippkaea orientalis PCC 8801]
MTNNIDDNKDVLAFLADIIPDTPEMHLIEKQEVFRISLTQAMKQLRKKVGLTQKQLAEKLGVTQSWVSKLESANNDHTFESVLAYLNGLLADFEITFILDNKKLIIVPARLQMTPEEINEVIPTLLDEPLGIVLTSSSNSSNFNLISAKQKNDCQAAQELVSKQGLWGGGKAA